MVRGLNFLAAQLDIEKWDKVSESLIDNARRTMFQHSLKYRLNDMFNTGLQADGKW